MAGLSRAKLLQQQQEHDHGRLRLDAVPQALGHVDPGARLGFHGIVAQRQLRLAVEEVQDGGHRGGVFGKLLALGEAEGDRFEPVVTGQDPAQDDLLGRLDLLRQIEEKCAGYLAGRNAEVEAVLTGHAYSQEGEAS